MPRPRRPTNRADAAPANCWHDYIFDADLEEWVCQKCGKALSLVAQQDKHECGPDCDKHGDIAAIG